MHWWKYTVLLLFLYNPFHVWGQNTTFIPSKLIYPGNAGKIKEASPTFSWTSATPVSNTTRYEVRIVEILPNQTPEAAIQANPDQYLAKNLPNNLFMYPVSAPLLVEGKKYAWQVTTLYQVASQDALHPRKALSEVFWFELAEGIAKKTCVALPESKLGEVFYVLDDFQLRFRFEEDTRIEANKASYRILNNREEAVTSSRIKPEKVGYGDYYVIPLKKFREFRKRDTQGAFYILEITDTAQKVFKIKFTNKK